MRSTYTPAAFVTITATAVSCFALAHRFAAKLRWRGWVVNTIMTGILTTAIIAAFGATNNHPGVPAGLLERLATGVNTVLGLAIFGRYLLDRRLARQ